MEYKAASVVPSFKASHISWPCCLQSGSMVTCLQIAYSWPRNIHIESVLLKAIHLMVHLAYTPIKPSKNSVLQGIHRSKPTTNHPSPHNPCCTPRSKGDQRLCLFAGPTSCCWWYKVLGGVLYPGWQGQWIRLGLFCLDFSYFLISFPFLFLLFFLFFPGRALFLGLPFTLVLCVARTFHPCYLFLMALPFLVGVFIYTP